MPPPLLLFTIACLLDIILPARKHCYLLLSPLLACCVACRSLAIKFNTPREVSFTKARPFVLVHKTWNIINFGDDRGMPIAHLTNTKSDVSYLPPLPLDPAVLGAWPVELRLPMAPPTLQYVQILSNAICSCPSQPLPVKFARATRIQSLPPPAYTSQGHDITMAAKGAQPDQPSLPSKPCLSMCDHEPRVVLTQTMTQMCPDTHRCTHVSLVC